MYVTREFVSSSESQTSPWLRGLAELSPKVLERHFALYSLFSRGNYILYHLNYFLQQLDCVMADANKTVLGQ